MFNTHIIPQKTALLNISALSQCHPFFVPINYAGIIRPSLFGSKVEGGIAERGVMWNSINFG